MSHSPESEYLELELNSDMAHQWRKLPECSGFVGNARSKHTIVAYDSCIYVFGGNDGSNKMLNDVLVFDTNKMSWSRACNGFAFYNSSLNEYNFNSYPECRYNHTAVVHKHSMFVFGGYIGRESVYANCNDLYEYQFLRASWIKWETSGTKPAPRSAHGCAVYDDKLWIFAGYDGKSRLNDMWQLPLNSYCKSWKEVQQYGDCPPTCCNFASTVARDSMYVFSGQSGARMTNDLFRFHFDTQRWYRISMSEHFLRNGSFPPTRRYGHTMVTYDRFLYVFGGAADSTLPSDLHAFDLDEQTWSIIKVARNSQVPSCRLFHSTTVIEDCMYVFGGTVDNNVRSAELFRFRFFIYPKCTLRQDFGLLLQNQRLCDIEFQFKDISTGNECSTLVHISFVAARSKYFCNTITEMIKKQELALNQLNEPIRIQLDQMNSQAFILLLHYIYTDQIDFSKVTVEPQDNEKILLLIDVYTLALRFQIYQIERLKNICIQYLNIELSIDNALVVLENAVRLNLEFIKTICMKFIVKESNYLMLLMTKEFENLPKSLLIEIVRKKENQNSSDTKMVQTAKPPSENNQSHTLEYDIKKFLRKEEFTDICLVLGQEEFKVHKAILAARSKYFEAIFRNFMPRDNRVSFQLGDMTPTENALLSLLNYIYCGDTNIAPQHCLSLYLAPNFLGFTNNRLHIFCKHNLESNVNESNVLQVLIAANQLNITEMKQYALNIITRNFSSIAKQNDINELDKNLLLEIIQNVAKVFKV